ncbi:hypothetical protein E2C01_030620 [Portunus trituberculatus]|uniref:Uncharacterized protein n=1 Tax=Portunus trituberculatus TaxID=210409 RepID=A0A5B7EVB9_PORTR|nr:hypothetical protein [Portunus trituberculatus]
MGLRESYFGTGAGLHETVKWRVHETVTWRGGGEVANKVASGGAAEDLELISQDPRQRFQQTTQGSLKSARLESPAAQVEPLILGREAD